MHTRLLAGNFAQFLMIMLAFASIAKFSSDKIFEFYATKVFDVSFYITFRNSAFSTVSFVKLA